MELIGLVKLGMPVLVLGMLLLLERINGKVNDIQGDIREIRHNITWQDTCDARHEEINRRLGGIDRELHGGYISPPHPGPRNRGTGTGVRG